MTTSNTGIESQEGQAGMEGVRDSANKLKDNLQTVGRDLREAASGHYEQVRDQANQYVSQGREYVSDLQDSVESHVRRYPTRSLLVAAGVGVLLGLVWRR
jgi:ElaB/YqjD/DUF883 family membrane-anchored ribosome-binding protein